MVHHTVSPASAIYGILCTLETRYPILYGILVLPVTVVRFISFHEEKVTGESHQQPVATFLVGIIFVLSGVFNALLYRFTRARLFRGDPPEIPLGPVPPTSLPSAFIPQSA